MPDRQLDLFSGAGFDAEPVPSADADRSRPAPAALDDATLIAAITGASFQDCHDLAAEAGRRRLVAAVPAFEALCRRLKGFGSERPLAEQVAALDGLTAVGGREAAQAVARILADQVVQGPVLAQALTAAAELGANLTSAVVVPLLRHSLPEVRAGACRCARPWPEAVALLAELVGDLNETVAARAACALGRMGRSEGRAPLLRLLRRAPSAEAIQALAPIADEDGLVLLGRIARARTDLTAAALDTLDDIGTPRAAAVAAAVRRARPGPE